MPPQVLPKIRKTGGQVNRFRLTAGAHVGPDYSHEFTEEEVDLAKEAGRTLRWPTKHYKAGDIIESDQDLVHLLGGNRIQLLGPVKKGKGAVHQDEDVEDFEGNAGEGLVSSPTPMNLDSGFTHPGGQVNTGFQATGKKDAFGNVISGAIAKDELEERGILPDELPDKSDKHSKKPVDTEDSDRPAKVRRDEETTHHKPKSSSSALGGKHKKN